MIQANELRIGNIVEWDDDEMKGDKTTKVESHSIGMGEFFNPIPLTEEILLKCGFEKYNDWHDYKLGKFWLKYITDDTNWQVECGNIIIDIPYLHQLQNLYFALTGQELNTSGL